MRFLRKIPRWLLPWICRTTSLDRIPHFLYMEKGGQRTAGQNPLVQKIRMYYRKWLLVLLAAAFYLSVLFLADQLPAPKRDRAVSKEVPAAVPAKRGMNKQVVLGILSALVLSALLGAGVWYAVRHNGGKSAKQSVIEEADEVYTDSGTWKADTSGEGDGAVASLSEDSASENAVSDNSISEDSLTEEETVSADSVSEDSASENAVSENGAEETVSENQAPQMVLPERAAVAGDVLFVGDSRFVQMWMQMGSGDLYIAKVGTGYEWFRDEAVPEIDRTVTPGIKIVINMGVNDLGNVGRYVLLVNECAERWIAAGAEVYYLSVNPVVDGSTYATNEMIAAFNLTMQQSLDSRVHWIDAFSTLMESGIETNDGIHYLENTIRWIYDHCIVSVS
ncbi:MAG: hypothetical protein IJ600_07685 [Lachnospiraceae bacterium]|nr:hypothetical protein [Lachnospiraceae bacterium]